MRTIAIVRATAALTHGVFYTPARLAAAVAKWAIRPTTRRILDPAFGDGALLQAAVGRLQDLDQRQAPNCVWGTELDALGPSRAAARRLGIPTEQLLSGNFLAQTLEHFPGGPFDAIIGNPPYVRHHRLDDHTREWGRTRASEAGIQLSDRSDAWAYFCVHLLSFLAPHGRAALILPSSILHAEYALPVLHALGASRGRTHLIRIQQLQFDQVLERTIILLIDRSSTGVGEVDYREVPDLDGLESALESPALGRRPRRRPQQQQASAITRVETRRRWHLQSTQARAWSEAVNHPNVGTLGQVADLRIGVVTGANAWFVRTEEEAHKLNVACASIISRAVWLDGPVWRHADEVNARCARSRLLMPDAANTSPGFQAEVREAENEGLHLRSHCARRNVWWALTDVRPPDIFLPYMGARPPRLTLNATGATCTNAIHRVWLTDAAPSAGALVLSSWTSLWQLGAELHGRSYGGGVLKLEIGEASQMPVASLTRGVGRAVCELEDVLRSEGPTAAHRLADDVVLRDGLGLSDRVIKNLRGGADRLRDRRVG